MHKYNVNFSMPVHFNVKVEAKGVEEAIEKAMEFAYLTSFAGNGGVDKLIGTTDSCVSLDPGEEVLDGDGWTTTVERES